MVNAAVGLFGCRRRLLAAVAAAAAAGGCQGWNNLTTKYSPARLLSSSYDDPEADGRLAAAEELFKNQQYDKAQSEFAALADNTGNTAQLAERARFMQAECRRLRQEYPQAVDTYNRLLNDFPTGAYRPAACARMYDIAEYWLDDFKDELARRKDEKGILRKWPGVPDPFDKTRPAIDQEGRLLQALEHVHTHDITGSTADKALFWCGYVNYIRGNFMEADNFFSQLAEMHKDSPLRAQATMLAIQCKNNATGGAVYDGRKCAEALQLVHHVEATMPEVTKDHDMREKLDRAKFAIRAQQAEKDFKTAEYYERTGHHGSAYFYYELVRRRYSGTKYSDLAAEKMDAIKATMEKKRQQGTPDGTWEMMRQQWDKLFGDKLADEPPADESARPAAAAAPRPLPGGVNPGP